MIAGDHRRCPIRDMVVMFMISTMNINYMCVITRAVTKE